ncbi:MAG: hypothetical protein IPJ24_04375 [bacterium]|nr:hypothetical protein [bacterium]
MESSAGEWAKRTVGTVRVLYDIMREWLPDGQCPGAIQPAQRRSTVTIVPPSGRIVNIQVATEAIYHDVATDGQAEPMADTFQPAAVEELEHLLPAVCGDAATVVYHLQANELAAASGGHRDPTAPRTSRPGHGAGRVGEQLQDHLAHIGRVARDDRQPRLQVELDRADRLAGVARHEMGVGHRAIEVGRRAAFGVRELAQRRHCQPDALGPLEGLGQRGPDVGGCGVTCRGLQREHFGQVLQVGDHVLDDRVDLVGGSVRHLADAGLPRGVQRLGFGLPLGAQRIDHAVEGDGELAQDVDAVFEMPAGDLARLPGQVTQAGLQRLQRTEQVDARRGREVQVSPAKAAEKARMASASSARRSAALTSVSSEAASIWPVSGSAMAPPAGTPLPAGAGRPSDRACKRAVSADRRVFAVAVTILP